MLSIDLSPRIVPLVNEASLANYGLLASGATTKPKANGESKLKNITAAELFVVPPVDQPLADCCLSGLWLLHGYLDFSHEISQSIDSPEGSFWHGIMHRLEGDFGNSKYWYRNVGQHPVIDQLATEHSIEPNELVDMTQQSFNQSGSDRVAAAAIKEWICLFEYCYRCAAQGG